MKERLLTTILLLVLYESSRAQEWGYIPPIGPSNWSGISPDYSACGNGTMQSPIDILTDNAVVDAISGLFFFEADAQRTGTLLNDGQTVAFEADNPNELSGPSISIAHDDPFFEPRVTGQIYHLNKVDFHWGSSDSQGSEHFIDGETTAGEAHFIYFNRNYSSFEAAAQESDGLLIIALRIDVCNNYSDFDTIFGSNNDNLNLLTDNSSRVTDISWSLNDLHECLDFQFGVCREAFYVYFGSQTTPGCDQSVLWWVSADTRCITSQQLDILRMQRVSANGSPLVDNFRPLQAVNGRTVIQTGDLNSSTSLPSQATATLMNLSLTTLLLFLVLLFV